MNLIHWINTYLYASAMECTLLFFIHELCGSETVREMKIYSIKGSPHTKHVFDL